MKYITVIFIALSVVGCGVVDRWSAAASGSSTLCVDHVNYIQFTSGASVKYTSDGKISTC